MKIRQTLRLSHVTLAMIPLIALALITISTVRSSLSELGDKMAGEASAKAQAELNLHAEHKLASATEFYRNAEATAASARAIASTQTHAALNRLSEKSTATKMYFSKALDTLSEQTKNPCQQPRHHQRHQKHRR